MRILVVGSGAREHALCWKLAAEPGATVFCAPGNPGIETVATVVPVAATDLDGLLTLVEGERIELTVVGPEAPLSLGLTDRLVAAGRLVFGPTQAAATLETSKAFAKAFMARHGVPTADFRLCDTTSEAIEAIDLFGAPVVVKADGLAAGKGVVVAETREEAVTAVEAAMVSRVFGAAGTRLVVEEYLAGDEASFFVVCDGERGLAVGTAQDHKRVFDDDRGPNTGGMGAFAPSPLIDRTVERQIETTIVQRVLAGMQSEGTPFRGFLYVGLMLTSGGPRVIEFNVRFGDPEAQVVVPAIAEPLAPLLAAAAAGHLRDRSIALSSDCHVGVVLASRGYPGAFERGKIISGVDAAAGVREALVFHAGTARKDGRLVTDGGRVLTVVGRGTDYATAMDRAYAAAREVTFDGCFCRTDIGSKAREAEARSAGTGREAM
jgi:phosphoribosylamine---glycine ligase